MLGDRIEQIPLFFWFVHRFAGGFFPVMILWQPGCGFGSHHILLDVRIHKGFGGGLSTAGCRIGVRTGVPARQGFERMQYERTLPEAVPEKRVPFHSHPIARKTLTFATPADPCEHGHRVGILRSKIDRIPAKYRELTRIFSILRWFRAGKYFRHIGHRRRTRPPGQ